ncbi:MAG: PIN domain-containing protein [Polyangiaceae bacterium]|nr:PIN domain-containing protein [Polyangiaceae bacterium]
MVLVDTSVWIRFLANREPYASELSELLSQGAVVGHEFVFGELLVGDRGSRTELLLAYQQMHQAPTVSHAEVTQFVQARRLNGRGVGWLDLHLGASALVGGFRLWTVDARFSSLAGELGVAYRSGD